MEPEEPEYSESPKAMVISSENAELKSQDFDSEDARLDRDVSDLFSAEANKCSLIDSVIFNGGRVRWRRPADGICELCNVKISASNWSRHLKRKHPNNLKYFIRPSSHETTVNHRRDATSTDVISQLPPPHSSSTSPTPSVSVVKHAFIAPHTITIPSSTPSVHVYAARPISSASAVTDLINGSGGADLSAEARLLTIPKINRLFTLFVATAGLTVSDLENEYLARFLASIPNFHLPDRPMEVQMNEELDALLDKIREEIRNSPFPVSISAQIECMESSMSHFQNPNCSCSNPLEYCNSDSKSEDINFNGVDSKIFGNFNGVDSSLDGVCHSSLNQYYLVGLCAHYWCERTRTIQSVGIDMIPLTSTGSDEDAADASTSSSITVEQVSALLADSLTTVGAEHAGNGVGVLRYIVNNSCRVRPTFFKLKHASSSQKEELLTGEVNFIDADAVTMSRYYGPYFALSSNSCNHSPTGEFMNGYESSCASFKLNAIMKEVCEQDATLLDFRNRIFDVFHSVAERPQMLADMHSYRMLFPANAQWSTLYHTYVRLLDVLSHFNALCIDYDVPAISADDTATLQEIVEIATPFVKFINKLEQETRPTISLLFPGLLHLISTLQTNASSHLPSIRKGLQRQIHDRFSDVINADSSTIDPLYLCASILDPTVAFLLDNYKPAAISSIRILACTIFKDDCFGVSEENGQKCVLASETVESPFGFGTVTKRVSLSGDKLDVEVANYLALIDVGHARTDDAIAFWLANTTKFPLLSRVAKTVLSLPATSASARRLLMDGLRSRNANAEGIRRKALLNFNKSMISV